jgi:hypothetical protein
MVLRNLYIDSAYPNLKKFRVINLTIVGFNFTRIAATKTTPIKGKFSVKNKVEIKDIVKHDLPLGKSKQSGVRFMFRYESQYEPKIGEIVLEGDLLYLLEEKEAKGILDEWIKNKKIPQAIIGPVLNTILTKANLQALVVSRDVNLPPSVPLPKVQMKTNAK